MREIRIRIPAWSGDLLASLLGLAGLATVCVMVAFLTDWRWGGLAAGLIATGLSWWISQPATASAPVKPVVAPLVKKVG